MRFIFFILFFSVLPLQGIERVWVPPLPPRERASTPAPSAIQQTEKKSVRSELTALGFEIGTIGVQNTSSGDIGGLELLFGIRTNYIYSLGPKFFLKPSLGYFLKPEKEGEVSVTQHLLEIGFGLQYALLMKKSLMWHVGLSQRMDYLFSRISIKDSSTNTPGAFRYRAGTSTGLRFKLSQKSDLTFDLEAGAVPFDNFRIQAGFSSGIIFFID